jgi:hypothetical protein
MTGVDIHVGTCLTQSHPASRVLSTRSVLHTTIGGSQTGVRHQRPQRYTAGRDVRMRDVAISSRSPAHCPLPLHIPTIGARARVARGALEVAVDRAARRRVRGVGPRPSRDVKWAVQGRWAVAPWGCHQVLLVPLLAVDDRVPAAWQVPVHVQVHRGAGLHL